MPHQDTWKYVEQAERKSPPTVNQVMDDYYGRYQCNVPSGPMSFKASAKTKAPWKGLKEGK